MEITVNGENREVPDKFSAAQLLESMQITGTRVAMEVNREIVPRSTFAEHLLKPGDRIEIVHAIGGG
jgi:sulfur carrier protein